MAVRNITNDLYNGTETNRLIYEYQCLTTDTKPPLTTDNNGSTCVVLNATTKLFESAYIWHDDDWYEV